MRLRVAEPPPKPVMLYDGDCRFCRAWIERWKQATGNEVAYVPLQDRNVPVHLPEIPRSSLERAVHFVDTTGNVYAGAEAVFRSLAVGGSITSRISLWAYRHMPAFAAATETAYGLVARHRTAAWQLTRLFWGNNVLRCEYRVSRWLFLRLLGLIYLIAFWSLWVQIDGLFGSDGILPAQQWTDLVRESVDGYWYLQPSLIWYSASDRFLHGLCAAGVIGSLLVVLNLGTAPALVVLWLAYQALTVAGQVFLGYQWDALLLEVGFVSILLAPWRAWPVVWGTGQTQSAELAAARKPPWTQSIRYLTALFTGRMDPAPSRVAVWLLRWVLFRLMFESGCGKLAGGDPAWSGLTALHFHYETQPLPTWVGWWAHQLPAWFQGISVFVVLFIEIAVPFLIFLPRRARHAAFTQIAALQVLIALTGNYCFFNWLTLGLCVSLLDDAALAQFKSRVTTRWSKAPEVERPRAKEIERIPSEFRLKSIFIGLFGLFAAIVGTMQILNSSMFANRPVRFGHILEQVANATYTVNKYGLFIHMTRTRPEIVIQGSADGVTWVDYEFKHKPGALGRRPEFVAPHQPRLDWQMWFAALGDYRHNRWLLSFMNRLQHESPDVLGLIATNPFPSAPPRYIRAIVYEYHFTDRATRRATGEWWRREYLGLYCPMLTLKDD